MQIRPVLNQRCPIRNNFAWIFLGLRQNPWMRTIKIFLRTKHSEIFFNDIFRSSNPSCIGHIILYLSHKIYVHNQFTSNFKMFRMGHCLQSLWERLLQHCQHLITTLARRYFGNSCILMRPVLHTWPSLRQTKQYGITPFVRRGVTSF